MPLTLLLDLDDTLLETNLGEFVPAYFQALAKHLSGWVNPDVMLPALMAGTRAMLSNEDPGFTLQAIFEGVFYPGIKLDKATLTEPLEDFYNNAFRLLAPITKQRPGARDLVDSAIERGFLVGIATDPLFPMAAERERIRWAGLDPDKFDIISSFETFHFTKSHPTYYAEVLGRLGWPDGPVLMAGNDPERDLARAQELGLMTYQFETMPGGHAKEDGSPRLVGRGDLAELCRWLNSTDGDALEPSFNSQAAIMAILRSTPAVLQGLVSSLSAEQWKYEPTPNDWAIIELVSHLRDTEREVHHAQIRTLTEDAQPFVPRPDAAVWAKQRKYLDEDGSKAVADFVAARRETLSQLGLVRLETWNRAAKHAIFGPTNFMEVVGFMADHDRLHIQQAWRTLRALP